MPYQFGNYSEIGLLSYKSPMLKLVSHYIKYIYGSIFSEQFGLVFTELNTPLNLKVVKVTRYQRSVSIKNLLVDMKKRVLVLL